KRADCGLRIADCGFMSPSNRRREIETESLTQSAIPNPQSPIPMPLRRFIYPLAPAPPPVFFGPAGYRALEGWSWFDGLYMTVITLATIGYGETHPLTPAGRAFTIILIVVGVTVFGFLISILTQAVVETEIASVLGRRRLFKDISQLK